MSEAPAVRGVLLGHGAMPAGMVDAVRHITGCDADALVPLSNRGMAPDALAAAVREAAGDGPTILFTDLQSGSCGFVARRLLPERTDLAVVSGVNLPVLIDFVMHRNLPLGELVPRLLKKGRAAICCTPADMEEHGHRAASH
jgi:mannose/fructose-specific phosphotransferase system component IIA